MNHKSPFTLLAAGIILGISLLAACGGNDATPSGSNDSTNATTAAPTQTVEPVEAATTSANDLATSVAIIQNPPTRPPSGKITPAPKVSFTRKFHFASLNGTLTGWQIIPGDGITCPTISDMNVALSVQLENTAAADYILRGELVKILGPDDTASSSAYAGSVSMGKGGNETLLRVPASSSLENVFCTGITKEDDPNKLTLVLGDKSFEQVRVPLSPQGPADMGGYVEQPLDQKFTFKGSSFTLTKLIVTTGVWSDQGGEGQSSAGKRWLLIPTQVNNATNPNLFIEPPDVTLQVDGQTLAPALNFYKFYQPAPYGLAKGESAQGAFLFEIPQEATGATLLLVSGDPTYKDDVKVALTLPALH